MPSLAAQSRSVRTKGVGSPAKWALFTFALVLLAVLVAGVAIYFVAVPTVADAARDERFGKGLGQLGVVSATAIAMIVYVRGRRRQTVTTARVGQND
jgi:hypothetical protein